MAGQQMPLTDGSFEVFNGLAPRKAPRTLPLLLDFSIVNPIVRDLALAQQSDKIEWVQGVYVDNSANPNTFSLTFAVSGQTLTWPANWQGYLPVLCPNEPRFTAVTTGSPVIPIQLLTFPIPAELWPTSGTFPFGNVTGAAGADAVQEIFANSANLPLATTDYIFNGTTWDRRRSPAGDAAAVTGFAGGTVENYNGSNYDRQRNNVPSVVLLSSSARTTQQTVAGITNYNNHGLRAFLNVTAASGTGGLQLRWQITDPISGQTAFLNVAPAAVVAIGQYVYDISPLSLAAAGAGITQVVQAMLSRTMSVIIQVGDASSYTYSLNVESIL